MSYTLGVSGLQMNRDPKRTCFGMEFGLNRIIYCTAWRFPYLNCLMVGSGEMSSVLCAYFRVPYQPMSIHYTDTQGVMSFCHSVIKLHINEKYHESARICGYLFKPNIRITCVERNRSHNHFLTGSV